jgi:hypothetical protein
LSETFAIVEMLFVICSFILDSLIRDEVFNYVTKALSLGKKITVSTERKIHIINDKKKE